MDHSHIIPQDREMAAVADDKLQIRLWLRLLACTHLIEGQIRTNLRTEFSTTLPRFDVLAQLHAAQQALSMGDLSARLMVTTGNVTGLIDAMERDGLVVREPHPSDRRSTLIAMSPQGRALFSEMAPVHQDWIDDLMQGLDRADMVQLFSLLGQLKLSAGRKVAIEP